MLAFNATPFTDPMETDLDILAGNASGRPRQGTAMQFTGSAPQQSAPPLFSASDCSRPLNTLRVSEAASPRTLSFSQNVLQAVGSPNTLALDLNHAAQAFGKESEVVLYQNPEDLLTSAMIQCNIGSTDEDVTTIRNLCNNYLNNICKTTRGLNGVQYRA